MGAFRQYKLERITVERFYTVMTIHTKKVELSVPVI